MSPKAIFAAPCQVEFDRMSAGPPRLETQQCGRLQNRPGLGMFPLLPVPTFAQVTRPSSRGSQSLSRMSRLIRLTSTYKKHGAPDCCFVGSSLASDSCRLESGTASQAHRPPCVRTPASPTLGSVISHLTST